MFSNTLSSNSVYRYTLSNDENLIDGYKKLGKGFMIVYGLITLVSILTLPAALYVVTGGILVNIIGIDALDLKILTTILVVFITITLVIGKYKVMETAIKYVIVILFLSLIVAVVMAFFKGNDPERVTENILTFVEGKKFGIPFGAYGLDAYGSRGF